MELYRKLESDMRNALKSKAAIALSVLRMLISAIKTFEIDKKIKEASDTDILQIIQRQIKQHKESIEQFKKGNRADLVEKELAELKILEAYMPEQLTEDELTGLIKEALAQTGAVTKSDTGKVMKVLMEKVRGRADGKLVNQLVSKLLK
ncbi:MAG: GatB/YqeY domain-containing protein [Candidatus Omnitrophica bacterium]|nr:GatB/YqeY domain-containing protein [Candidatus Omnitrophota bacterium]